MEFSGKTIVVTGGTGALGTAVVDALAAQGARCIVPYVHEQEMARFAQHGAKNTTLVPVQDLAAEADVAKLFGEAGTPLWASIHIAGGFAMGKVADTDKKTLMAQIEQNLVSCFLCCRAAVMAMAKDGGRIVNVAARPALEPRTGAGMSAYTIAKSGVAALTIALAQEVAKEGILVNAVAPSIMDTPANRAAIPKADFDTWPKVEEVAATILHLSSPGNRVTRGAIVPVYGKS
jgi:NAD(P)-dependent dehydrogenase (short-subunit alcohol dehydrogenase family)